MTYFVLFCFCFCFFVVVVIAAVAVVVVVFAEASRWPQILLLEKILNKLKTIRNTQIGTTFVLSEMGYAETKHKLTPKANICQYL